MKHKLKYFWQTLIGITYLAVVIGIVNIATTRFETAVLAVLVQLYSAVLWNFSMVGATLDVNNYAGFVRFRILATAQGVTENEDGTFEEQEKGIAEAIAGSKDTITITRLSHTVVSIYALFKIFQAVFS